MTRAEALILANHIRDIHRELEEAILAEQYVWETSEVLKPDGEGRLSPVIVVHKLVSLESLATTLERIAGLPSPAPDSSEMS